MATRTNLVIDQGAAYSTILNLTDQNGDALNLAGYTASAQMKRWYTSVNSVSFGAAINAASGQVTLSLTANQTSAIWSGRYVFDVQVTDGSGTPSRLIEGFVTVTPGVTNELLQTWDSNTSYENYFTTPATTNSTPPPYPGYIYKAYASQTLIEGTIYLVMTPGVTLQLPLPSLSTQNVVVQDATGNANPNITVQGNINGPNTQVVISTPGEGILFVPAEPALDIWIPGSVP